MTSLTTNPLNKSLADCKFEKSRTGSTIRVFRRNGELFGVPHKVRKQENQESKFPNLTYN